MKIDKSTLRLPAAYGVRVVALRLLEDVEEATDNLERQRDPDTLHDVRVAVRRTRSWLRAFKDDLDGSVRRKDRRRLREVASATNVGRDTDVHVAWLTEAARGRPQALRDGAEWLADYLRARQRAEGDGVTDDIIATLRKVHGALESRLSTVEESVAAEPVRTLGAAISERLVPHADAIETALRRVATASDEAPAHEARIAAKRLRYLMEPAAEHVQNGTVVVEKVQALQDILGDLHDAQGLALEIHTAIQISASAEAGRLAARALGVTPPPPSHQQTPTEVASVEAVLAVARRLGRHTKTAFSTLRKGWLGGRYEPLSREVAVFCDRLSREYSS